MKLRLSLLLLLLGAVVAIKPSIARAGSDRAVSPVKVNAPQASNSISSNEASMLLLLHYIHAAEATYQATTGNGRFGTLQELYLARLIDVKIRTGVNDGYQFVLNVSNPNITPPSFEVLASPAGYLQTGVRTFSINQTGEIRESYEQNPSPAQFQLLKDECGSVICTEAHARFALRIIHSAEATFLATTGAGRYGTLQELFEQQLISTSLASGTLNGYSISIRVIGGAKNEPPSFKATATPLKYVRTGIFSYYIDESGILRGGNKNGLNADPSDDPVCQ